MGGNWCCVEGCTNRSNKTKGVCYHSFPSDSALRKKWLSAFRRVVWSPGKNACVCSDHFTPDCYKESVYLMEAFGLAKAKCGRRLKENAVPTLFACTKSSHPPLLPRWRTPKRRQFTQEALITAEQLICVERRKRDPSCHATTTLGDSEEEVTPAVSTTAPRMCDLAAEAHVGLRARAVQTCFKKPCVGVQAGLAAVKDSSVQTDAAALTGTIMST